MNEISRIVVIGASAGGLQAITDLVSKLPKHPSMAMFVVLHVSKQSMGSVIAHHLQKNASMTCHIPEDQELIKPGHLYIAPPDHHMMIKGDKIRIHNGPHENRWRPSIDVLFRSAAVSYSSQVIGIILTGLLDDGTSGMGAIKRSGGICIVQEPNEAEFSDMPTNVLNNVDVDYRVPIADMPYIIQDLYSKQPGPAVEVPREIQIEADITERMSVSMGDLKDIASHTIFNCPDCGGGLWKIKEDKVHRYRCHTGHVYTEQVLMQVQSEELEETLWVSIRMLEERRNLLLTVSEHEKEAGQMNLAADKKERSEQLKTHIERLKNLLQTVSLSEPND
jgi:two-component system chemotaxis response regulator CheB